VENKAKLMAAAVKRPKTKSRKGAQLKKTRGNPLKRARWRLAQRFWRQAVYRVNFEILNFFFSSGGSPGGQGVPLTFAAQRSGNKPN
jgi:hypothetical protein